MENEIWKDIKGYEGIYQVSNKSRFKSVNRSIIFSDKRVRIYNEKILIKTKRKNSYNEITLTKNTIKAKFLTHVLVAKHFIDNPNNLPIVEHINDIKSDDSIVNLMWSTQSNNVLNLHYRSCKQQIKTVIQYDLNMNFIQEFKSLSDAGRFCKKIGDGATPILRNIQGKTKCSYGFIWKYKVEM